MSMSVDSIEEEVYFVPVTSMEGHRYDRDVYLLMEGLGCSFRIDSIHQERNSLFYWGIWKHLTPEESGLAREVDRRFGELFEQFDSLDRQLALLGKTRDYIEDAVRERIDLTPDIATLISVQEAREKKARSLRVPIPTEMRWEVWRRDGFACVRCGALSDLTCDHIFPVVRGGQNTLGNLQTLCRPCNSSKGAK